MLSYALQDVDQVGVDVDAVKTTSHDEALHDTNVFGAQFGPAEIPVFPAHRNRAQVAFQMVGVHRYVWVGEKKFQPQSSLTHIVERLGKGRGGPQAMLLEATDHPGKEGLHVRFAVHEAIDLFGFADESEISDVVLDRVERTNASECVDHALGFCGLCFNELAARMTPTQGMRDTNLLRIARISS